MLLGEKTRKLDRANRILLSMKERDELTEHPFLAISPEGYLALSPQSVWESWLKRSEDSQVFRQHSTRVEFDRQGRVRIPLSLVRKIGLTKKVRLVGNGDHLKILPIQEQDLSEKSRDLRQRMRPVVKRAEAEFCLRSRKRVMYITSDGKKVMGEFKSATGSFFTFVGRDEEGIIVSIPPEHFSKFFTGE